MSLHLVHSDFFFPRSLNTLENQLNEFYLIAVSLIIPPALSFSGMYALLILSARFP